MSHENERPGDLAAVEQALAGFSPLPPQLDRDRLMFLAGRANALATDKPALRLPPTWLWPASTATLAATSLALALALAFPAASPPTIIYRDRLVVAPVAEQQGQPELTRATITPVAPLPRDHEQRDHDQREITGSYLKSRELALRMGLDALGSPTYSTAPASVSSYRDLMFGSTPVSGTSGDKSERQNSM